MAIQISGSTIIDNSRNIVNAGIVTATNFVGNVTGNATGLSGTPNINVGIVTASAFFGDGSGLSGVSAGSTVADDTTTNTAFYPLFTTQTTGIVTATKVSTSKLSFNPSSGTLSATVFSGTLSGNATTATDATNATNVAITNNTSTNATYYVHFGSATSGNDGVEVDSSTFTYNPSTNVLTAGTFSGTLSGNISGYSGTYWTSNNDGSGSGLDADLLDGLNAATTGANTIVRTDASGNIAASGNVTAYSSDKRLKENLQHINSPLEKVQKLNGYTFDWNQKSRELGFSPKHEKNDIGLIAQEVQEVLPQAVAFAPFDMKWDGKDHTSKSGENYLTIQYERLVPLLIEAIKEQQGYINVLNQEIKELKKSIIDK